MLRKEKKCTPLDCWAVPFLVSRCPWFRNHPWFQNHSWLQNHRFWFQNHPVLVAESFLVSESFLIHLWRCIATDGDSSRPLRHSSTQRAGISRLIWAKELLSRIFGWPTEVRWTFELASDRTNAEKRLSTAFLQLAFVIFTFVFDSFWFDRFSERSRKLVVWFG